LLQSRWATRSWRGELTQYISPLAKALVTPGRHRLIVTIARKGYQFTPDVTVPKRQTRKASPVQVSTPNFARRYATRLRVLDRRFKRGKALPESTDVGAFASFVSYVLRPGALWGHDATKIQKIMLAY